MTRAGVFDGAARVFTAARTSSACRWPQIAVVVATLAWRRDDSDSGEAALGDRAAARVLEDGTAVLVDWACVRER